MNMVRHLQSPILDHCPEALPPAAYFDAGWFEREKKTLWRNNWICVGRLNDVALGTMRRHDFGNASVILCLQQNGELSAFHNTCRHRGSELCVKDVEPLGKLISCPYHAWSYNAADGQLVSVAYATPTSDFKREDHGLLAVQLKIWNGFVFVKLSADDRPLAPDVGLNALDNWPMANLVTGYRLVKNVEGNWKGVWDNYNECLHCPGIHPELCDLVPVYKQGVMADNEALGWTPEQLPKPNLKSGAESWTTTGERCGPAFPNLTKRQRDDGYTFVTIYPTMYLVAHVDYVRAVRLEPTGPETTRLTAEWYFPEAALEQSGFDAAKVAAFAKTVIAQDTAAIEMNQRGLRSPGFKSGRLMPQEFELYNFKNWVLREMEREAVV